MASLIDGKHTERRVLRFRTRIGDRRYARWGRWGQINPKKGAEQAGGQRADGIYIKDVFINTL